MPFVLNLPPAQSGDAMLIVMGKGYHYRLKLADGKEIEGEAVYFRASTTPQDKPIVLKTGNGIVQIDSKAIVTCQEVKPLPSGDIP